MVMGNGNAIKLSVLCSVLPSPCPALRVSVRAHTRYIAPTRARRPYSPHCLSIYCRERLLKNIKKLF